MITVRQDTKTALFIMKEVSEWLIKIKMPLWDPIEFENGQILKTVAEKDFYTAFIKDVPVAAMILKWIDLNFWPNSKEDSGFIHKLSVRRMFAGKGITKEFIEWAKNEVRNRKRQFLRLDCAADRPKLCKVYDELGFLRVDRRMVGPYDNVFYEIKI